MILLDLALYSFRNLKQQRLSFSKGLVFFLGPNAQGKTNLLEAIYTLATGHSFRPVDDQTLLRNGETNFRLTGSFGRKQDVLRIVLTYSLQERAKVIEVNSQPIRHILDLLKEIKAVPFSPQDLQLVKGSPGQRRQFINHFLCQLKAEYRFNLLRFSNSLKQRNAVLKKGNLEKEFGELEVWNKSYIHFGQQVVDEREKALLRLEDIAKGFYSQIGQDRKELCIKYAPKARDLMEEIIKNQTRELEVGFSLFGPHLDDLVITLGGKEAKSYCSEGEAYSIALAMRLAEWEILCQDSGEEPILVLDDVLSELDERRQVKLLEILSGHSQVFLSAVSGRNLPNLDSFQGQVFYVQEGKASLEAPANI